MRWEYSDASNRGDAVLYTPAAARMLRRGGGLLRLQLLWLFTIHSTASLIPPPFFFFLHRVIDLSTLSESSPVYMCRSVH